MVLSNEEASRGLFFMVGITLVGGIFVMLSFVNFGMGLAILSSLIFGLLSILFFVIALMFIKGNLRIWKPEKVPVKKSEIKSEILSIKSPPLEVKKGKTSDVIVKWKVKKKEYLMKIWLDEKTNSCRFSDMIKEGKKVTELGRRYLGKKDMVEEVEPFAPTIWPILKGKKDVYPQEARKTIWAICHENGWKMVRK